MKIPLLFWYNQKWSKFLEIISLVDYLTCFSAMPQYFFENKKNPDKITGETGRNLDRSWSAIFWDPFGVALNMLQTLKSGGAFSNN